VNHIETRCRARRGWVWQAPAFLINGQREARERAILPLRRVGELEDIAMAIAFLLSGDAAHVTGSTLVVDDLRRAAPGG